MNERIDVLLVCSPGGHLLQMLALEPAWAGNRRLWLTEDTSDTRSLLADEEVVFTRKNSERSLGELVHNARLAWRIIRHRRPRAIVSTGAAVAVPVAWIGRLLGVPVVHVESISRIQKLSLSGRMIAPVARRLYVQWPELAERKRRAVYKGSLFGFR